MRTNEEYSEFRPIRLWNEDDRPREKLVTKGKHTLSDAELIAILIGSGTRRESAVELSRRILQDSGNNLVELGKRTTGELTRLHGIGPAKAITIIAAMELGRRRKESEPQQRPQIRRSQDIYDVLGRRIADLPHEEFWVMATNRNCRVINTKCISSGGISGTVADVRMILRFGLENNATGLILCHNHPSGNKAPSQEDIRLTHTISDAAELMDIRVLDHLIVTESGYYSLADNDKLKSQRAWR